MNEHKKIFRWFWVWNFDKEEQWLNSMAQEGWALNRVGLFLYDFVPCAPGEYTIRLEMRNPAPEYLELMAESGAEYVGRYTQWLFFRKRADRGEFDLYSDLDSRMTHLQKVGRLLVLIGGLNLCIGLINTLNSFSFGWVNLVAASVLFYGLGRIHGKIDALKGKRLLTE